MKPEPLNQKEYYAQMAAFAEANERLRLLIDNIKTQADFVETSRLVWQAFRSSPDNPVFLTYMEALMITLLRHFNDTDLEVRKGRLSHYVEELNQHVRNTCTYANYLEDHHNGTE